MFPHLDWTSPVWNAVTALGTLLAALVAAWAAFEAKVSAQAAKDSVEIAKRNTDLAQESMHYGDRAYVGLIEMRALQNLKAGVRPAATIVLKNLGKTPCKGTVSNGFVLALEGEHVDEDVLSKLVVTGPQAFVFAPGLSIEVHHVVPEPLQEEQMRLIQTRKATFYAWGRAEYTDIFGRPHVTTWCIAYEPESPNMIALAPFHNDMT